MAALLFEDMFHVNSLNEDGKKFEKINRLRCKGLTYEVDLILDINSEIYSVKADEKITFVLASTLALDGTPDDGTYQMIEYEATLADRYDYVMHGRVFKYDIVSDNSGGTRAEISASFGGLMMRLVGDQSHLASIENDQRIYCLLRHNEA